MRGDVGMCEGEHECVRDMSDTVKSETERSEDICMTSLLSVQLLTPLPPFPYLMHELGEMWSRV